MSQIKVGALLSYFTSVISLLLGLIYTPWMIAVIGKDDYGLYTLAITLISIFLMDFGLGTSVSRFLSVYYAKGEIQRAHSFLGMVYKLYLALAAIVAVVLIILYFFLEHIYIALDANQLSVFKGLYAVVAFYSVVSVPFLAQNNILIANEKFIALKLCTLFQKLTIVGLTIIALVLGAGVFALVVVNACGNIAFILVKAVIIRSKTKTRARFGKIDIDQAKQFASFSGWVTLSQVCQRCNYNLMPSVLGIMSSAGEIAVFGLASQLESYVYAVGDALGGLFMPRVARILETENYSQELTDLMTRVGRLQVYLLGLIFTGFIVFGSEFVLLWLGEGYGSVWVATLLLIAPSMISLPQQVGTVALTTSNKVRYQARANSAMAVTCIVLSIPLTAASGAIGACCAIMAGLLLNRIMNNVYYAKHLGIDLRLFFRRTYLRWSFCAIPLVCFGLFAQSLLFCNGWVSFFGKTALFTVAYSALCLLACFDAYEKELIKAPLRKLISRMSKVQ